MDLVPGLRRFALELTAAAGDRDQNLVFSPLSIAVAFAMAQAGASEETAERIRSVFGFPPRSELHRSMAELVEQLGSDTEEVVLDLANAMWVQEDLALGQEFLDTLVTHYGAGPKTTDFRGEPNQSRELINTWVSEATRGRIDDLIPHGMITPLTIVMLVNAVYLKAQWVSPFWEQETSDQPFHLADGSTVDVPTMSQSGLRTTAAHGSGYSAVDLAYVGGDLRMTAIVPDGGVPLADFEAQLDGDRLGQIVDSLGTALVDLRLPRWEIGSRIDLARPLTAMGLPIPGGDLRGVAPGTDRIWIDAAVHAANITVDEKGTEAAAATAVAFAMAALVSARPLEIRLDRPFLYLIRHVPTGAPVFYGRVVDPRG